jgi:hypothetical protein
MINNKKRLSLRGVQYFLDDDAILSINEIARPKNWRIFNFSPINRGSQRHRLF